MESNMPESQTQQQASQPMTDQQQQQINQQQQNQQQQQQQQQTQHQTQQPPYTIPGILHYLQYEWHRFEVERQEWEVERAELLARIALLQGDKKSHENLKHDLIRRIKMLEYCLRMERAKYHKLKHGTDPPALEQTNQDDENSAKGQEDGNFVNSNSNSSAVTYGRELLRHYLQEIGYTETIIDLRSNRVHSLLNFVDGTQQQDQAVEDQKKQELRDDQDQEHTKEHHQQKLLLQQQQQHQLQQQQQQQIQLQQQMQLQQQLQQQQQQHLHQQPQLIMQTDTSGSQISSNKVEVCLNPQKSEVVDIGELAALTALGSEPNIDDYRRKQWSPKYRLQSHYDCVRALKFSETDSLLVTASEDQTIKLWHLSRSSTVGGKSRQPNLPPSINAISSLESSTLDIEPVHTYRGHKDRILCVTVYRNNIFSGDQGGTMMMWNIVSDPGTADQFDKFDSSLLVSSIKGHDEAVWSVEVVDQSRPEPVLCSASADLTIKIWNIAGGIKGPIRVIKLDSFPTCIAKMPLYNVCQVQADIAVSFSDGKIRLYDIASCLSDEDDDVDTNTLPTATFECEESHRINSVVVHPTLPYMASADSHHDIKFWDMKTRKCKSTMVAHLDEVTSLAFDPTGKYLLSASHDCSVRLWLFEEKACIQEITSHRKKFDEGIFAVAFHPKSSQFATAGADGLAKVFV